MYTLNLFQNLAHCPEDESVILSSLYNTIAGLSVKQGNYVKHKKSSLCQLSNEFNSFWAMHVCSIKAST